MMNDILTAIERRSSTRSYTPEKLTGAELDALIRAALQAPTAANRQEIHVTAVEGSHPILAEIDAERIALDGAPLRPGSFYYDAPAVLFLSGDRAFPWSPVDAGIAVENIALAAEGLGLGSVIIGCIRNAMAGEKGPHFAQALRFPEGYEYEIAIAVGRKAAEKEPHTCNPERNVSRL